MGERITVDVKEAARITGLSRSKIYKLIQDQDIVAKKLGRRTLIEVSILRNYISKLPAFTSPSATGAPQMTKLQNKESADQYAAIIIQIDSRTRVIRRRHDLQWIMQKRSSPNLNKGYWIDLSYHTTWESLINRYSGFEVALNSSLQTDTAPQEEVYLDITDGQD